MCGLQGCRDVTDEKSEESLLQVFPGDVRVPRGSSTRWGSAQSKDVRSEGGQSLGAKVGVDEVQMSPHDHHGRVWSPGLQVREKRLPLRCLQGNRIQQCWMGRGRLRPHTLHQRCWSGVLTAETTVHR